LVQVSPDHPRDYEQALKSFCNDAPEAFKLMKSGTADMQVRVNNSPEPPFSIHGIGVLYFPPKNDILDFVCSYEVDVDYVRLNNAHHDLGNDSNCAGMVAAELVAQDILSLFRLNEIAFPGRLQSLGCWVKKKQW
jgi:hypothetical protein